MNNPKDFSECVKNQQLETHRECLRRCFPTATDIQTTADERQKLSDFRLNVDGKPYTVEAKTDYHEGSHSLCIELASNLPTLPIPKNRSVCNPRTPLHDAITHLVQNAPSDKLGLGLDTVNRRPFHLVSYLFPGTIPQVFYFSLKELQEYVAEALESKRHPLVFGVSQNGGAVWYSVSMLIPIDSIKHLFFKGENS